MVLQKRAPAKSHEKTWELAGRFSGVGACNSLISNEYTGKRRHGSPANLFGFLASVKNKLVKVCERFSGVISYRRNVLDIHDRGEKV